MNQNEIKHYVYIGIHHIFKLTFTLLSQCEVFLLDCRRLRGGQQTHPAPPQTLNRTLGLCPIVAGAPPRAPKVSLQEQSQWPLLGAMGGARPPARGPGCPGARTAAPLVGVWGEAPGVDPARVPAR